MLVGTWPCSRLVAGRAIRESPLRRLVVRFVGAAGPTVPRSPFDFPQGERPHPAPSLRAALRRAQSERATTRVAPTVARTGCWRLGLAQVD